MKAKFNCNALLSVLSMLISSVPVIADHSAGGEISYQHMSGNDYIIKVTFYRDCAGDPAPDSINVTISSSQCSVSNVIAFAAIPGVIDVTFPCGGQFTTCQGGTLPGIQMWEYESIYTFPGQCPDWMISTTFPGRNAAITTIQNAAGSDLYLEARLNNQNTDNTSPFFVIHNPFQVCLGQTISLNNGAVDIEGDSLVYTLIPARTGLNTNVSYQPGFSAQQPITSVPPVTLNPQTGDLILNPFNLEVGPVVFQIEEWRNGELIGVVMRDMLIYTIACNNLPPDLSGINGQPDFSAYVLPNTSFCFSLFTYDPNAGDILTMSWNQGIAAATFTISSDSFPTGTFCWSPSLNDVRPQPYTFSVTVHDLGCPFNNTIVGSYSITVGLDSSLVTPLGATGLPQHLQSSLMAVFFPNPFQEFGEIRINSGSAPFTLRIFNAMGQEIFSNIYDSNFIRLEEKIFNQNIYFYELIDQIGKRIRGQFIAE